MYPNLYYALKDLFGLDLPGLKIVNSFGLFVAIAFIAAAYFLSLEFKRKQKQGLIGYTEEETIIGKPASTAELLMNFIVGFFFGFKIIAAFSNSDAIANDPQAFIFSSQGSWFWGILIGIILAGLKYWEKNKQKLTKPEKRTLRIWASDRVGDITIVAAIFGLLGAKLFHNLENWDSFIKDPLGGLLSLEGLTMYGGLICAGVAVSLYATKRKINFWHLVDSCAPALMIAYAIGRIGCQVAGDGDWGILNSAYVADSTGNVRLATSPDEYKYAVTANFNYYKSEYQTDSLNQIRHANVKAPSFLPTWTVAYTYPHNVNSIGIKISDCDDSKHCNYLPVPVFPTPFYETLVCTLFFFILWFLRKRISVSGKLFGLYLCLNGLERFFIEKIRVNTTYNVSGFHPTQAEIIASMLFIAGLLMILLRKNKELSKTN